MGGPHQRRARTDRGVGDPRAVGRRAEVDVLAQVGRHGEDRALAVAGLLLDRGDEAVPAAMDGLHDPLVPAGSPTACRSCLIRVVRADSRHEVVAPDGLEQLGLGHHPVTVLDQVSQHVEHLRLDVHELVAPAQLVAGGVEHGVPEAVPHGPILSPRQRRSFSPSSRRVPAMTARSRGRRTRNTVPAGLDSIVMRAVVPVDDDPPRDVEAQARCPCRPPSS